MDSRWGAFSREWPLLKAGGNGETSMKNHARLTLLMTTVLLSAAQALAICPANKQDPFAIRAAMSSGPYKGHCINTDRYRSARRLTDREKVSFFTADDVRYLQEMQINVNDSDTEVMANFQDVDSQGKDHFYVAVVPKDGIQGANIQMTRLSKILPIEHGQILLEMRRSKTRPVVLFDQTLAAGRTRKILNDDIILTVSGVRPIDHEEAYNAFKGLNPGYYNEEFQIGSNRSLTLNWIRSAGLKTQEYRLNVSVAQARTALSTGVSLATEHGVNYPYSTLTSSCLNMTFLILHQSLKTSDAGILRKLAQSMAPLPSLVALGLVNADGSSWRRTLR